MEKEILLKEIENTNHLNELYPLWNEFKAYLENQPSLLELGQLFGFNYHLQEKFNQLSQLFIQEKKYQESIEFHQDFINYFNVVALLPLAAQYPVSPGLTDKNLALSYFYQDNDQGISYFQELLERYPYDYEIMDAYFSCLYKQNNLQELKNMIQKHLPLSIEYNIETENIIHHVIELFKAINEEELALQYAQIEKQQNDFGKKKPTKVIKVGRNDPCPCGSGKKYKKCCGKNN